MHLYRNTLYLVIDLKIQLYILQLCLTVYLPITTFSYFKFYLMIFFKIFYSEVETCFHIVNVNADLLHYLLLFFFNKVTAPVIFQLLVFLFIWFEADALVILKQAS